MSGNTATLRIILPQTLMTIVRVFERQSGPRVIAGVSRRSIAPRDATVRRDEGRLQQRKEEPVPVSLSPPVTAEQADLAHRFRELMLPHLDAAYNLARYLLRDPVTAEDVAQDAFLRAFRAFDGYRGGDPKAWILAIVRNCCYTSAKAAASCRTVPLEAAETAQGRDQGDESARGVGLVDPADSPETTTVRHDEIATMRELIEDLPIPFREALVLREFEELSYHEIAEVTGAPIGTVMSRLARARHLLGDAWRRRTSGPEEERS